jgi:formylglycine-generating enzyme required for sulfatase activity
MIGIEKLTLWQCQVARTVLIAALALGVSTGLVHAVPAARMHTEAGPPLAASAGRVHIGGGRYRPLYRQSVRGAGRDTLLRAVVAVDVPPFLLDRHAVTNADYLEFVRAHPEWRRSRVSRLFADESYLHHWRGDLDPGPAAPATSPAVYVSWFAARAYCSARAGRLPTVAEWELVAAADETRRDASRDRRFLGRVREWYSRPATAVLPEVGHTFRNVWGVDDMHGLVWEWTLDFNSALVSGESRADASLDRSLYCGAGASGAADFVDYAAFMRFAFRSSLQARYTTGQLGFRVAYDPPARAVATAPKGGTR